MRNDKKMKGSFIRRMSQTKIKQKAKKFQNNSTIRGLKIQKIFKEVDSRIEILTTIRNIMAKNKIKIKFNRGINH